LAAVLIQAEFDFCQRLKAEIIQCTNKREAHSADDALFDEYKLDIFFQTLEKGWVV